MDYVDGEAEDRNVGEFDHCMTQQTILFWLYQHEKQWGIRAIQRQRTRMAATEVLLPDVSVFSHDTPIKQVFTRPQFIAIEVLSPENRHSRMAQKIQSYIRFGVAYIWVIDPKTRAG